MRRLFLALLVLAITARAQDGETPDPLAMDKTLLAPTDDSTKHGPLREHPEVTGAKLLEGLEESKRIPQLEQELEEMEKELEAATVFTLSNFLDSVRVYFLGGEAAWQKESNLRMAKADALFARTDLATASSEFVKAVHDTERGVSFSCPPDHTMAEMYEIVRVWLQENPGAQHLPAETCVVNALKAKWPKTANGPATKNAESNARMQGTE